MFDAAIVQISEHHLWQLFNCLLGAVIAFHGICSVMNMTERTPYSYWLAYTCFTIGGFGVAIGPLYGYWSANPMSVILNSGALAVILFKTFASEKWRKP